jgi:hypothetical protein
MQVRQVVGQNRTSHLRSCTSRFDPKRTSTHARIALPIISPSEGGSDPAARTDAVGDLEAVLGHPRLGAVALRS